MFMLEKAVVGNRRYWAWIGVLCAFILVGFGCYVWEHAVGLGITGLSRDLVWGLYIAQFVFFVGVGASAVVVVLPYYLHDWKAFGKIVVLGEFLAISAVTVAGLFILANLGQPARVLNVILYPSPSSLIFWDLIALTGYILLNALISLVTLSAERKDVAPPAWIRPVILLSIPWAVSIHTVTAFLFSGLPGRSFWLTGLLAPRFLASAFASGPALLILLAMAVRRLTGFESGREAIRRLSLIITYTMTINLFFLLVELFTTFYGEIPEHMAHFEFLFVGLNGHAPLAVWMWISVILAVIALVFLMTPRYRNDEKLLAVACVMVFLSLWIDKGLALVVGGFMPTPLGHVTSYVPTLPEISVTLGIWAVGFLMLTIFYKIALSVREGLTD
jgi:molybdopterin-containing oxidoreductase family membrane subunit